MIEFERWLSVSIAEAECVVPDLLARVLRQELRTVGVMRRLLDVATRR